jgi:hypothetical protein
LLHTERPQALLWQASEVSLPTQREESCKHLQYPSQSELSLRLVPTSRQRQRERRGTKRGWNVRAE